MASAAHSVGVDSALSAGQSFATLEDQWTVGLRVRVPIQPFELGATLGYGEQEFRLGAQPDQAAAPVPNFSYGFLSGVLDARWAIGSVVSLSANAGYLLVTSDGIVQSGYFPHASVAGLQAGLALGVTVYGPLELRLGVDYQRFFFSMNPTPGDEHVAGGAIDQYLASTLSLAVHI